MEWPIFFKENLKIGNLESSVGICTLWTQKEHIYKNIPDSKYSVCGNLYTVQGINYLIKNVLANPKIRYIILCGADLTKSGDALINLMKFGIDNNRKIINSSGYVDSNIDRKLIENFRKNVMVIDMRDKEKEVPELIESLENAPPFSEPVFITEEEPLRTQTYSDEVGFKITANSIPDAWLKILDIVMKFGENKPSEYGINQKEILNVLCVIENDSGEIPKWMNISENDLENYYSTFFSEEKKIDVSYTYGERLFKYELSHVENPSGKEISTTYNQIEHVIKKLKESPFTRRAIASTWKVKIDTESEHPPCLTQITWNVKNNRIHQTAVFRSHDIFGAWPLNAFALRKLQKDISQKTGIEIGSLIIFSNSAHIYENDWKRCNEILNENYRGKITQFKEDKNGYFNIMVKDGEIIVQHHVPDGRKSEFVFRGKKAQLLYRQIIHENLISLMDHAAYIGHELARAEMCLKENKNFVQDEA